MWEIPGLIPDSNADWALLGARHEWAVSVSPVPSRLCLLHPRNIKSSNLSPRYTTPEGQPGRLGKVPMDASLRSALDSAVTRGFHPKDPPPALVWFSSRSIHQVTHAHPIDGKPANTLIPL